MSIKPGDIVRVSNPDAYIKSFSSKVKDRDAIVKWVGPLENGNFKNRSRVEFQQRNGRGKTFSEVINTNDLVLKDAK